MSRKTETLDVDSILSHLAAESDLYGLASTNAFSDTDAPAAAVRLHCYGDGTRWLIASEELYFNEDQWGEHDGFRRSVWAYGTGAERSRAVFPCIIEDGDAPLFSDESADINSGASTLHVRGIPVDIPRDPDFLAAHSIELGGRPMRGAQLYRALCSVDDVRAALLSTAAELREALGIHESLKCLLVLDDWAAPEDPDRYDESEVIRLLAEVIVTGDPKHYRPTLAANMHFA